MYYKVIQDGMILDAWQSPQFVKYKKRFNSFELLKPKEVEAVVDGIPEAADAVILPSGSDIWMLSKSEYTIDGKEVIELKEITEEEYIALVAQLEEEGGGIVEPEPEVPEEEVPEEEEGTEEDTTTEEEVPEEPVQEETVMTRAEMSKAIRQLQEQNAALAEQNTMLEECLIEMSVLVYA